MNPSLIIEMFRSKIVFVICPTVRQTPARKPAVAMASWGTCALLFLLATASLASAQGTNTVVRLEVRPLKIFTGANYSTLYSNNIVIADLSTNLGTQPIVLSVSAPSGITATLSANLVTNDANHVLYVAVTNLSVGTYPITITASNTVSTATWNSNMNVYAGNVWINTNAAASLNWSTAANWSAGAAPSTGTDVKFEDAPPQGGTNAVTISATNLVDSTTTIGSLFYIRSANGASHSTGIGTNVTLSITGTNGFGVNVDSTNGNNKTTTVNISGQGGRLVVNNTNAVFTVNCVNGAASGSTLTMSSLDSLAADVSRFTLLDVSAARQGGIGPQAGLVSLARTNIVRAYSAPSTYAGTVMTTSIEMCNNGEVFNNGSSFNINMGITNAFFADSLGLGMGRAGGDVNQLRFNPGLARDTNIVGVTTNFFTNSMFAYFRNNDGGRMTLLALGVDSGTNEVNSGNRGRLDTTAGTVDMMVDQIWLGRDREVMSTNANSPHRGYLLMGRGTIDANVVIAGYQQYTNDAICRGIITVGTNGLLRINDYLELGYSVGDRTNGIDPSNYSRQGNGTVTITDAGRVMANKIQLGGPAKLTAGNTITINTGGNLIVSNKIAGPDLMLQTLTVSGNSTLTLHLNGTNTGYYVYATNLNVAAGCTLNIASVSNLPIPPEGTNVPLLSFVSGGGNSFAVTMPSPMRGTVLGDVLNILTNQPKNLVWRGPGSTWNTDPANKVWLDTATTLLTNYVNGDAVTFDDLASAPDTITLSGTLIPDTITVSNGTGNPTFIFSGSGTMPGGSLVKNGSGTIEIDANTAIPVQINQGAFTGTSAGSVGSVVVASGASMDFSGTVSPSGVTCAGTASLRGTVSGGLLVQAAGIVTNYGTLNGPFDTRDAALLVNASSGNLNIGASGSASGTVVSNATFINVGNIGAALVASTMSVNGVFKDMGLGTIYVSTLNINGSSLSNNAGAGTFIPGGDSIGTTTIKSPGVGGGNFPGRVVFLTGSTNIFKVNVDGPTNYTILRAAWTDFGPSVGSPTFNGGFLLVTNVGSSPLAAGQSFRMFKYEDDSLSIIQFGSTNSYPIMSPSNVAPALAWDLSTLKPGGNVAIKSVPATGTNITFFAIPIGAHITSNINNVSTNFFTNHVIYSQLSWPSNYIGWHLEEKLANSTNGLNSTNSDWTPIFDSYFTNVIYTTNVVSSNSVGFYRMVFP